MTTATNSPPTFLYAPDFFKTNRIFTELDRKLVRQHLDYAEANLLDLSRQQRELADCIERCRVALAPIKKLSDDVLRRIFTICCESPTEFFLRNSKQKPILTIICQVCSAWRGLALETPVLWSQISLFSGPRPRHFRRDNPDCVEDAVKLWFTRASTCPISLEAGIRYSTPDERELCDLVGRIFALRSRYRKLVLKFHSKRIGVLLGKLSPDQLSHLEELETINVDEDANSNSLDLPFSPTTFANLKNLVDSGYWNSNNLSSLLPFSRLKVLNIQRETTMELVLELLQQCPLLETCQVKMEELSESTIDLQITHPQLRNLWIQFYSSEDCCLFIDQLVLGNLQSLWIVASSDSDTVSQPNEVAEHVVALSQRSGTPNIREIYLNKSLVPILDPGILLRSLPHLEKIDTYGRITLDEGTLDGLAMGTIGRRLMRLHANDIEADLAIITRMAEQRAQNVELSELRVTSNKSVLEESPESWSD